MGWLGLDDTDHLGGGCTTWTMQHLISSLPTGTGVVGDPCLVRLYPMTEARTRGNAALAVELNVDLPAPAWHAWLEQHWREHLAELRGLWTPSTHALEPRSPATQAWSGSIQSRLQISIEWLSRERFGWMKHPWQRGQQEDAALLAPRPLWHGHKRCPHGKVSHGVNGTMDRVDWTMRS